MAKKPAKLINVALGAVALEGCISNVSLDVRQELPVVTALSDAGPRRVVDNYDYGVSMDGAADFAAGQSDATLFGQVGGAGAALAFDPTGAAVPGVDDPHYDAASVLLESYSIKGSAGAGVTYSATLQGNSALARAVA